MSDPGAFWNARFGAEPTVYGEGPNVFFAQQLALLKPGRILLPGDGEGRNAVHAAVQGWSVRSFDASSVGVDKALAMAKRQGVTIEAEVGDAHDWAPGEAFDAIGLCYLHTPPPLRGPSTRAWWTEGHLNRGGVRSGPIGLHRAAQGARHAVHHRHARGRFCGLELELSVTEEVVLDEGPTTMPPRSHVWWRASRSQPVYQPRARAPMRPSRPFPHSHSVSPEGLNRAA